jgi:Deoxyribonuclease II
MLAVKIALLLMFASAAQTSRCVNENGTYVNWFVALREPNSKDYLFFDSWSTSFRTLEDEKFLQKLFQQVDVSNSQLILWNDEPGRAPKSPVKVEFPGEGKFAHDKGMLHRSATGGGFYLLHSVPGFPSIDNKVLTPSTPRGPVYGQSMLCISLSDPMSFDRIWKHLAAQKSQVYYNSFKLTVPPVTKKAVEDTDIDPKNFRMITKTVKNDYDLPYEDILVPILKTGWLIESWGRPYLPDTTVGSYQVINNLQVTINSHNYTNTQDHSKYAVALNEVDLVCFGGLNHQLSQIYRGGSFVCFSNSHLYNQLRYNVMQTRPPSVALHRLGKTKLHSLARGAHLL